MWRSTFTEVKRLTKSRIMSCMITKKRQTKQNVENRIVSFFFRPDRRTQRKEIDLRFLLTLSARVRVKQSISLFTLGNWVTKATVQLWNERFFRKKGPSDFWWTGAMGFWLHYVCTWNNRLKTLIEIKNSFGTFSKDLCNDCQGKIAKLHESKAIPESNQQVFERVTQC